MFSGGVDFHKFLMWKYDCYIDNRFFFAKNDPNLPYFEKTIQIANFLQ